MRKAHNSKLKIQKSKINSYLCRLKQQNIMHNIIKHRTTPLFLLLLLFLISTLTATAQTSRRKLQRYADEGVRQLSITGRAPTIDVLDSLAANAEVSIEMLSRMGDPDDARQASSCLKLIDAIVAYGATDSGMKYGMLVRAGLKKSIDRSYEPQVQSHLLQQLAKCAKPADAAHIATYLQLPQLEPIAANILATMPGIDDALEAIAKSDAANAAALQRIMSARRGAAQLPQPTTPAIAQPQQLPLWTTSLNRHISDMAHQPHAAADSLLIAYAPEQAAPRLLAMARRQPAPLLDAVMARMLAAIEQSALTGAERYLLLYDADQLPCSDNLRRKIILMLGDTHTIQALAHLRRYYGKPLWADAMAIATTTLVAHLPQACGGNMIMGMLYSAKQSFIRHYDEQGVDAYIDQVLAAIDNCHADGGYNMAHTETTRMQKRGFWVMHTDMTDADLAFDWNTQGTLTVSIHSTPLLLINRQQGACLVGTDSWQPFKTAGDWCTAHVSMRSGRISVSINGQPLISDKPTTANAHGYVKFEADDNGATIRQYCFKNI